QEILTILSEAEKLKLSNPQQHEGLKQNPLLVVNEVAQINRDSHVRAKSRVRSNSFVKLQQYIVEKHKSFALEENPHEASWLIDGTDIEYLKKIGDGGSGKVFKAILNKDFEVAVKVIATVDTNEELEGFKR